MSGHFFIRALFVALLGTSLFAAAPALAQVDRNAATLTRALAYDYNLKSRAGDSVVVAILYRQGSAESEAMADGWLRALRPLESAKIQGLPFRAVKLAWDASTKAALTAQGVDVLLTCEGLDADTAAVRELARSRKLLTVGARQSYVEEGMSLGVFTVGDRLQIWVNLKAASEEGVSFSSDLLRLARVLK